MSCLENEVLYEKNLELFHEQVFSDSDLENLVIIHFATQDEYEEAVNRAFDAIWKADMEMASCGDAEISLNWWIENKGE